MAKRMLPISMETEALLRATIAKNGERHQTIKAAEEFSEASAAISRHLNGYCELSEVALELADTLVVGWELCLIHPELRKMIEQGIEYKLERLAKTIDYGKEPL